MPVHEVVAGVSEPTAVAPEVVAAVPELPADVRDALAGYFTCEFATVNRRGEAIAWPSVPYVDPEDGHITCAVSIAFPVKAYNAARHPRVSLLFSDPTGSGLADAPAVLVQGTAAVAEVLDYPPDMIGLFRTVSRRQPDSLRFTSNRLIRRLFTWYLFQRIALRVTPERITVWPGRDFTAEPRVYEVRHGG
jgi:hypothetical protein